MGNLMGLWKEQSVEADASIAILTDCSAGISEDYIEITLHSQDYQTVAVLSTNEQEKTATK
jgi:hypothetical protein